MDCPICSRPVPPGGRGQVRRYCSPACRKRAELNARTRRKLEASHQAEPGEVLTREQILVLLTTAARSGSVSAAKALLEELRRDDTEPHRGPSVIDDILAKRRPPTLIS